MVSKLLLISCLALGASPACSFVSSFARRTLSSGSEEQIAARTSAIARQSVTTRKGSDLSMRSGGKFVVSQKAREEALEGPSIITMNIKTREIIRERTSAKQAKENLKRETATAGPGLIQPDMELFCKAAADGNALGDCPFTHYIQMVLHHKNLPFKLTPCAPDKKPDWLVEEYEGQMPCLVDSREAYTDSANIVEYIEYFYPEPTLSTKDDPTKLKKANDVTKGVFGALAKCVKNLDTSKDTSLVTAVLKELKKVDAHLQATKGPFLAGEQITLADCSFAPKLYHASTCLAQFKNSVIPPEYESLHKYMDMIFSHDAFVKSSYPPDVLVWGWNKARGTEAK